MTYLSKSRLVVFVILATLVVGLMPLAAGNVQAAEPVTDFTIAWSPPVTILVYNTVTEYLEKAAEQGKEYGFNIEVITQAPVAETDFADQVRILEDFIERDVDVIVLGPADIEPVIPAIKKANEKGIPVIIVNMLEDIPDVDIASYIGFSNYDAGYEGGMWVGSYFRFKDILTDEDVQGNIALMQGVLGTIFEEQRTAGFEKGLVEVEPSAKIVAKQPANWVRQDARTLAEDFIVANPDLNFIYAESAEMTLGALTAVQSAGKTDQIAVGGQDGTTESLKCVADGDCVMDLWHGFPEWGWRATDYAVRLVNGLEVPHKYDIGAEVVDKSNVAKYYPEPSEEVLHAIDWEGILAEIEAK
jgi:ribose transport system substrate-binding protein